MRDSGRGPRGSKSLANRIARFETYLKSRKKSKVDAPKPHPKSRNTKKHQELLRKVRATFCLVMQVRNLTEIVQKNLLRLTSFFVDFPPPIKPFNSDSNVFGPCDSNRVI